jgi:hypothetical protein
LKLWYPRSFKSTLKRPPQEDLSDVESDALAPDTVAGIFSRTDGSVVPAYEQLREIVAPTTSAKPPRRPLGISNGEGSPPIDCHIQP